MPGRAGRVAVQGDEPGAAGLGDRALDGGLAARVLAVDVEPEVGGAPAPALHGRDGLHRVLDPLEGLEGRHDDAALGTVGTGPEPRQQRPGRLGGGLVRRDRRSGVRHRVQVRGVAEPLGDVSALLVREEDDGVEAVEVRHDPAVGHVQVARVRVRRVGQVGLVEDVDGGGARVQVAREEARGALRLVGDHRGAVPHEVVEPEVVDVPGAAGQHRRAAVAVEELLVALLLPRHLDGEVAGERAAVGPVHRRSARARGARRRCAGTSGCPPPRPWARRCRVRARCAGPSRAARRARPPRPRPAGR